MGRLVAFFALTRAALLLATLSPWPDDCRSFEFPSPQDPSQAIVAKPGWRPTPDDPAPGARGRLYQWSPDHPTLDAFARWDASFYFAIAVAGYAPFAEEPEIPKRCGFLPGYALIVRYSAAALNGATGGPFAVPGPDRAWVGLLAAFVVSNGAFLVALIFLRRLALASTGDAALADRAVFAACVAPTSFFFSAALSESVFLALSLASLDAAYRRKMFLAAAFGALAAFTRPVGLFLAFPLLLAACERRASFPQTLKDALKIALVPIGFAAALAFAATATNRWNAYFLAQAEFGHEEFPTLDGVRHLLTSTGKTPIALGRDLLQIASIFVASVCLVPLFRAASARRFHWVLIVWTLLSLAFPLLSDDLVSMPRYLAAAGPVYIGAAMIFRGGTTTVVVAGLSLAAQVAGFLAFSRSWPIFV